MPWAGDLSCWTSRESSYFQRSCPSATAPMSCASNTYSWSCGSRVAHRCARGMPSIRRSGLVGMYMMNHAASGIRLRCPLSRTHGRQGRRKPESEVIIRRSLGHGAAARVGCRYTWWRHSIRAQAEESARVALSPCTPAELPERSGGRCRSLGRWAPDGGGFERRNAP